MKTVSYHTGPNQCSAMVFQCIWTIAGGPPNRYIYLNPLDWVFWCSNFNWVVEGDSPNLKCTNLFWWLNPINPIWFEMPDSIKIILNLIRLKYRCLICICLKVIFMIIVTFMRAVTTLVVVISHLVIDFHFLNYEIKQKCIFIKHF